MKPNNRIVAGLALAVVCLTAFAATPAERGEMNANGGEAITNGPLAGPGDASGARSELRNVRDSDRYESLVHSIPNFRAVRDPKECGPSDDAPMHAECDASLGR